MKKSRKVQRHAPLNEIVSLPIASIGAHGDGVSAHNGKAVYVPKTAPGDVVKLRLETQNSDGYTARLMAVEMPSPVRAYAPCPYFERCGGCALQHVTPEFYRDWKIEKVRTALERAGVKIERWEEPVFLKAATRRRTTVAAFRSGSSVSLGYHEPRTHNIVNVKACMILEPVLDLAMQAVRDFLPRLLPDRKACDIMLQRADGVLDMVLTGPWRGKDGFALEQLEALSEMAEALNIARISLREKEFAEAEILLSRQAVIKNFGVLNVALPPGAFLQASAEGETALTGIVARHAKGANNIADLFAGCGTFTGALLEQGAQVFAADNEGPAIEALATAQHPQLKTQKRDLFKNPMTAAELNAFEAVVFDPPRAGAKALAQNLAFSDVPKIIAVSCSPTSFARDAKALQDGGYKLQSLTVIDQFVWSAHVETVALFTR